MSAFSFATFLAACVLTARVMREGNLVAAGEQFFIDPFNVFLVDADGVRRPHDRDVLAPVHAHRARARPYRQPATAPVSQHVPALHGDDAGRAHHQQHGAAVGRDGGGDALDRAAGDAVPDAREPRGRLEVLHPVRRRHRAGAVRHDPAVLRGREGAGRRRRGRAALDASGRGEEPAGAARPEPGVRLPAGRLRHQGGPRAAAQLAAGRACGGPDAGLGGAVRPAAERRDLRGHSLQGAGRRVAAEFACPRTC